MRTSLVAGGLGLAMLGLLVFGCGDDGGDSGNAGMGASASAGTPATSAGGGGQANGSGGDMASSGKPGATAGKGNTGEGGAGTPGGDGGASTDPGAGGTESNGGAPSGDLVDCDTRKVLCKIAIPECPANEVVSVIGTCYGPCVKIDRCACSNADECPNANEYTCWMKKHCGPYVK